MFAELINRFSSGISSVFSGPMQTIFHPINNLFNPIPEFMWQICAVALFVGAMVLIMSLRKQYVNVDQPHDSIWFDLRLWTVVSMLPHVFIYLWF